MRMKRILSAFLALTVICGVAAPFGTEMLQISLAANAAEIIETGVLGDNITYTLDSDGNLSISGSGYMYDYDRITFFSPFQMNGTIRSVVISDEITSIGSYLFYECKNLESITIPDSVASIGIGAFKLCESLTSVTIPDSVTCIGKEAFYNCPNLESITFLNPECEIYDDLGTISAGIVNGIIGTYTGVIKGYDGSTAQTYAGKYHRKFQSLGAVPEKPDFELGDVNENGKIDATDATLVLVNYSLLSTGEPIQLTDSQQNSADVNGDGKIDASDATLILQYYSYLSTGGDMDFYSFIG